jgi:hypothetical protein
MTRRLILILLVLPALVWAQPQQSENFRITKSVLDAGGGPSTSTNFQLTSAFGQPTPIGLQWSENFVLSAGFLSPMFAESPLSPISNLVIKRMPALSMNMRLDWGAIPGAFTYYIYRDTNPLFTPGPGNLVGTSVTNQFIDANAVGLPAVKYFYIITSSADVNRAAVKTGSTEITKSKHTE